MRKGDKIMTTAKVFENGSGFAGEPLSTLKGAILK